MSAISAPQAQRFAAFVAPDEDGERLDRVLARRFPDVSRARFQALIADGSVTVEGAPVHEARRRVKAGERVEAILPEAVPAEPRPERIALDILFEDDDLIVIDKPAGLVVHPAAGHETGTLVNALMAHCGQSLSGIGGVRRPGIVHRLDKDTSGIMVAAKSDRAHRSLAEQFAAHGRDGRLVREYLALVWGTPERRTGRISAPVGRSASDRKKMAVAAGGRDAVTHYDVIELLGRPPLASLVRCRLDTGRTHQIRVHMAHLGHPIMGDPTYAKGFSASERKLRPPARVALSALGRQALHAFRLGFEHPVTHITMLFESELPPDISILRDTLRDCAQPAANDQIN
ncbi:MAG: RluA family pseudouridine synthase [Hyphomicrobiales bacterium]